MRKVVNDCRITEKRIKFAFILMITAMVLIILPASFLKPQEVKAGGDNRYRPDSSRKDESQYKN